MRLPKSFRPKKKLEEKIEQLVKGARVSEANKKTEVTEEELEDVRELR